MAIFSSKKNTKEVKAKAEPKTKAVVVAKVKSDAPHAPLFSVIIRPRVTEKASMKSGNNVFTFEVAANATKHTISKAVLDIYKVSPLKVNIVTIPSKKVFVRGKAGMKSGGKKAYVYLKKGETIDIA